MINLQIFIWQGSIKTFLFLFGCTDSKNPVESETETDTIIKKIPIGKIIYEGTVPNDDKIYFNIDIDNMPIIQVYIYDGVWYKDGGVFYVYSDHITLTSNPPDGCPYKIVILE